MWIIGISFSTESGKTMVVGKNKQRIQIGEIDILAHDSYYFDNRQIPLETLREKNYNQPDSNEFALIYQAKYMMTGIPINEPVNLFKSCIDESKTKLPNRYQQTTLVTH